MQRLLNYNQNNKKEPSVRFIGVKEEFIPWMNEAEARIFSMAAGNRIGKIAPKIMRVGFGKVLYAASKLGSDIYTNKPYIVFAPDGTSTYNIERIKRGFTYGAIINMEFDGLMATNNSMPNGCGMSIYELENPDNDDELRRYLQNVQRRIGRDNLTQLGKGNHFAGLYKVLDPISGEDTNRRFVIVHCSGHAGGDKLYFPDSWLNDHEGYHLVHTPHGSITLLEGDARKVYTNQYHVTNNTNANNRDETMAEIFPDKKWIKLEEVCHQGLLNNGDSHMIGTQVHDGLMPIAFNPEEGLITVRSRPNLNSSFIENWDKDGRADSLGITGLLKSLNLTPHGGGYEFKQNVEYMKIFLGNDGIDGFETKIEGYDPLNFTHFKEIREYMTFRRRNSIMKKLYVADLAEIIFENPVIKQIYPLESIPGGIH